VGAALPLLDQALRLAPDDVRLYVERGLAHAGRGDAEAAFDDLARAASMIPEDPEPFEAADALLERLHRLDEAAACWTSYLERNRSDARGYRARARALGRLGLPGLSAADATKACALGLAEACVPSTPS
jgi:tetratricopeptide (TPR) repeat protein